MCVLPEIWEVAVTAKMRWIAIAVLVSVALGGALLAAPAEAQQTVTLTVRVRNVVGNPVEGLGVHLYSTGFDEITLIGDQLTDANGSAAFSVTPLGSYSVAIYAPAGFSQQIIPEDEQYLAGMGEDGIGGLIGIGLVMGEQDYTLRLVLQEGRPYHDRSPNDLDLPEPYIPGVTDKDWPTPTPYGLVLPPAGPTTPAGGLATTPTAGSPQTGTASTGLAIDPAPFPWGPVLVIAGIVGVGWTGYQLYSRGTLAQWAQSWRRWRRSRKRKTKPDGQK